MNDNHPIDNALEKDLEFFQVKAYNKNGVYKGFDNIVKEIVSNFEKEIEQRVFEELKKNPCIENIKQIKLD